MDEISALGQRPWRAVSRDSAIYEEWAFTTHGICQCLEGGLPRLQDDEKEMFVVHPVYSTFHCSSANRSRYPQILAISELILNWVENVSATSAPPPEGVWNKPCCRGYRVTGNKNEPCLIPSEGPWLLISLAVCPVN